MAQWSPLIITICLYVLFVMVVFCISFPLKSHSKRKFDRFEIEHVNEIGLSNESDDGNGIDDSVSGGVGDGEDSDENDDANRNERRYLERARNLPSFSNRSDILRDAFQR